MQPSMELKELVLRTYEAMGKGDTSFYDNHLSQQDGVLIIGSDPNEWWTGYDTIIQVFKAQMREMGGVSCLPGDPQAYSGERVERTEVGYHLSQGTEVDQEALAVRFLQDCGDELPLSPMPMWFGTTSNICPIPWACSSLTNA